MNNNYLRTPSINNTLPYLFYINVKITMHNKNVFRNTLSETLTFLIFDFHTKTCPTHFKLLNLYFKRLVYIRKFLLRIKC
jgi:hypothetical protein